MLRPDRRRAVLVGLAMVSVSVGARHLLPTKYLAQTKPAVKLTALFPESFGEWRVDTSLPIILPAPDVQARLDQLYSQVLSRTYVDGHGRRIMLSVAYGQDQSDTTQVHRPEVCYPSQGFQLMSTRDERLMVGGHSLPVRRVETRMGGRIEPVTYWVVVGDTAAVNRTDQKMAQLHYIVKGLIPDGMLVRVSSIDPDSMHAFQVQDGFLAALRQHVSAAASNLIFGRPPVG